MTAAGDSANRRDLLANDRTLLAYIRTALSFAGLGFAVAKFGLTPKSHVSGYLGTFMVLVGLLVIVIGFVQHAGVVRQVGAPSDMPATVRVSHVTAAVGCVLVCALLAIYLAANAT
jgi:putative membrane protein